MKVLYLAIYAFVFSCQPLMAEITVSDLHTVFKATCSELAVPQDVTMAIAHVESGFNPWAVNIEGKGYQFDSKEDALAKAQEAQNSGRSFDVGVMQVNNWWLKKFDIPLEAALDPEANIYLGGWILKQEIDRHPTLKAAVGAYHSPNQTRANRYANLVMAALNKKPPVNSESQKTVEKTAAASVEAPKPMPTPTKKKPYKVEPLAAAGPMTVISRTAALAKPQTMTIIGISAETTMKVRSKR